jgi:hypothetical protein
MSWFIVVSRRPTITSQRPGRRSALELGSGGSEAAAAFTAAVGSEGADTDLLLVVVPALVPPVR